LEFLKEFFQKIQNNTSVPEFSSYNIALPAQITPGNQRHSMNQIGIKHVARVISNFEWKKNICD
jgi:hypothetical protein